MTGRSLARLSTDQAELVAQMRRRVESELGVRGPDGRLTLTALAARSAQKRDLAEAQMATTRLLLRQPTARRPSTKG